MKMRRQLKRTRRSTKVRRQRTRRATRRIHGGSLVPIAGNALTARDGTIMTIEEALELPRGLLHKD